jgi:hypothetical protein
MPHINLVSQKEFSRSFLERKRINVQLQQQAAQQQKAMATTASRPAPAANVRKYGGNRIQRACFTLI